MVASVFAFTILSAGTFSTERGKEAIYAGLEAVRSSMELRGGLIATSVITGTHGKVKSLVFTVGNVAGGEDMNVAASAADDNVVVITYRDLNTFKNELVWTIDFIGTNDNDTMLEAGELAEITIELTPTNLIDLGTSTEFALEMKPSTGSSIPIQRTTPPMIDPVMDLQ